MGVDTIAPDVPGALRTSAYTAPVHRMLLGGDILVVEHLCLAEVSGRRLEEDGGRLLRQRDPPVDETSLCVT